MDIERARELLEENAELHGRVESLEKLLALSDLIGVNQDFVEDAYVVRFAVGRLEYTRSNVPREYMAKVIADRILWKLDEATGINEQCRKKKEDEFVKRKLLDAIARGSTKGAG